MNVTNVRGYDVAWGHGAYAIWCSQCDDFVKAPAGVILDAVGESLHPGEE